MIVRMPKTNWTIKVDSDTLEAFRSLLQGDDAPLGFNVGLGNGLSAIMSFFLDSPVDLQKRMLNREVTGRTIADLIRETLVSKPSAVNEKKVRYMSQALSDMEERMHELEIRLKIAEGLQKNPGVPKTNAAGQSANGRNAS